MARVIFLFLLFTSLIAEEKISIHSIETDQGPLDYTTAVVSGDVSYISYIKEGPDRPITFAFNGGPGSSSVWLHLGTFGPRRLISPEEGQKITPPYPIVDNPETILDLTDIVFIDPMGTGLSNEKGEDDEKNPYSVTGDIEMISNFIRDYLTSHNRWNSPKYLAGESYGTLRAAGVAEYLQKEHHISLNGVILISAALDYQTLIFDADNPLAYFLFLPTYATTAWYHDRHYRPDATLEEVAQEARDFAFTGYASSLICRKCYDSELIHQKLAAFTGLPLSLIQRHRGRIENEVFALELLIDQKQLINGYDSRFTGYSENVFQDPTDTHLLNVFSGAFHSYLNTELDSPSSYRLLSYEVNTEWNYRNYNFWGYPSLMSGLRRTLIGNPSLKIFVGCGYFDMATPFAAAEYCFDHLDVPNISVQMEYYEGGHMYYLNPSARKKFKQDLIRFYQK